MVQLTLPTPFTFIAHYGFDTRVLAYMLDSLVRVSRRVGENHFVSIMASHFNLSPAHGTNPELKKRTPAEAGPLYLLKADVPRSELMLTRIRTSCLVRAGIGSHRFPFSNFKSFSLSFQSSLHLSLAVLVRYRSLADI
jgi:hypothetical protein